MTNQAVEVLNQAWVSLCEFLFGKTYTKAEQAKIYLQYVFREGKNQKVKESAVIDHVVKETNGSHFFVAGLSLEIMSKKMVIPDFHKGRIEMQISKKGNGRLLLNDLEEYF